MTVSPLYLTLHKWQSMAHVWGLSDCMTVICDWCVENGHPDPLGDLRWGYDSAISCQKLTGYLTDPLSVCAAQFEGVAGLKRGNALNAGDVGVVRRRDDPRFAYGMLWTGHSWAGLGENGAVTVDASMVEVLAFWSVGYEA
uniref:DUF6950 family protein n=1 Tax=Yoonia sp. TaxID=2212373 RepID=UPI0040487BD1